MGLMLRLFRALLLCPAVLSGSQQGPGKLR
jgi:hypothetical protein